MRLRIPAGAFGEDALVYVQPDLVPIEPTVPKAFYMVELNAVGIRSGAAIHDFAVPIILELQLPPGLLSALREVGEDPIGVEDLAWWQYDEAASQWLRQDARADSSARVLSVATW